MFRNGIKNIMLVCAIALVALLGVPQGASAGNNPVVGTWIFTAFSYDSRPISAADPASWNRGKFTLNSDFTVQSQITSSSGTTAPQGISQGTYTITSDGQINLCVPTNQTYWQVPCSADNPGVTIAGRLDKTNDVIVATMMINPQQPAMVTAIRQAPININKYNNPLLGAWAGQILRVDSNGNILWDSSTITFQPNGNVVISFVGSNGETGGFKGTYTVYPADGHVTMKVTMNNGNPEVIDMTAQISATGDMGSIVMKSEAQVSPSFGMGTMINTHLSTASTLQASLS